MNESAEPSRKALVVLSGGQDSTTCLYWAIAGFGAKNVATVTFDYGQRHIIELEAAAAIAKFADVPNTVLPINTFAAIGGNALTDSGIAVAEQGGDELPNTFVAGRNLIFLTFAAAFAYDRNIRHLVTGVAQTDYSGYPDCRAATIKSLEQTIALGMERTITIHTPLMFKSKKETVLMARELNALPALALSHTCYNNRFPPCAACPACLLRARGFAEAGIADPLLTRAAEHG